MCFSGGREESQPIVECSQGYFCRSLHTSIAVGVGFVAGVPTDFGGASVVTGAGSSEVWNSLGTMCVWELVEVVIGDGVAWAFRLETTEEMDASMLSLAAICQAGMLVVLLVVLAVVELVEDVVPGL